VLDMLYAVGVVMKSLQDIIHMGLTVSEMVKALQMYVDLGYGDFKVVVDLVGEIDVHECNWYVRYAENGLEEDTLNITGY
jgi:hypothetical protein